MHAPSRPVRVHRSCVVFRWARGERLYLPDAVLVAAHEQDTCVQMQFDSSGEVSTGIFGTQPHSREMQLSAHLLDVSRPDSRQHRVALEHRGPSCDLRDKTTVRAALSLCLLYTSPSPRD